MTGNKDDNRQPRFSKEELEAITDEVMTNAYSEDEELTAWETCLDDELVFPFPATVIGKPVEVLALEQRDRGLKFAVRSDGKKYWINVLDVDIDARGNEKGRNTLLLAAYRKWINPGGTEFEFI